MTIAESRLHADPGGEGREQHPQRTAAVETDMQRDRAMTIFEKSQARPARVRRPRARRARRLTSCPPRFRRAEPPQLPEVAEPEIVRHYNRLSKRNFDLDTGFYPLGSCTMKHNPKLHERVAALPGNARLHPLQAPKRGPGRAGADVTSCSGRSARSPGCRTSRCSRRPAPTASSPACC